MADKPADMTTTRTAAKASSPSHRFSARYRRRRFAWNISLNFTPMIDLVFLLLFFFLTVSRFQRPEGMLPARLPSLAPGQSIELPRVPVNIRLAVDPGDPGGCRLTIDRFHPEPMSPAELAPALRNLCQEVPGFDGRTPVYLVADDTVAWDHVVNAYNAAIYARFERIFFTGGRP
ncbi:MAG TPA: biopolymer transporter ExbD [Phycisphaerae bacterium]|nr:biopolymer transporter ExbD [Phycisphaerae bacterium]